jgi:nucleoside-diphosphate-sugar epimerase
MKYLITGGAGFIGSNIVKKLLNLGHSVVVIDNESSTSHDNFYYVNGATYYKYDVKDYTMCSEVFNKHKFDYVLHLAAEARVQNCVNNPALAFETNVQGTVIMLELCKKYEVKKLILSSTSAIYGLKNTGILNEKMEPDCLNAYSLSKFMAENVCKLYSKMCKVDTVCFRYFNVYGPNQTTRGTYASVTGIFKRQKDLEENITVIGDGEQTRDYIHVDDIVDANIIACEYPYKLNGEVINVGTGKNYSVNWIANAIQPDKQKIINLPERIGEARHTIADISKIQNILNWKPKIKFEDWIKTQ